MTIHRFQTTALVLILGCWACGGVRYPGERWVKDLRLTGNRTFSSSVLLDGLATRETSWWPFAELQWYDPSALELDALRIEAYYATRGFYAARVRERKVAVVDDGEAVDITLVVDEGKPTLIQEIEISGSPLDGRFNREFRKLTALKTNTRFDYTVYEQRKEDLHQLLRSSGYPYGKVNGAVEVNRKECLAKIRLNIEPGPLVRFGKATLEGQEDLPARQVLRYTTFEEGDRYDPAELENTQRRFTGLGVFSSIQAEIPKEPTKVADVKVTVTKAKLHELRLGGGIGIENQRQEVRLRANWTFFNFLGGLRTLSLKIQPAFVAIPTVWSAQRLGPALDSELRFTQPDIFSTYIDSFAKVAYRLEVREGYRSHGPDFQLGVERTFWRQRIRLSTSWNMELREFFDVTPEAAKTARDLYGSNLDETYRPAWIEQTVSFAFRDSRLDPRAGVFAGIRFEGGIPELGSTFSYIVLEPDVRAYVPLGTKRIVLALRAMFGQLWQLRAGDSPLTRRLEMGGPTSHRGFSYGRLAPQAYDPVEDRRVPIGGNAAVLFSSDLRFRTFKMWGGWVNIIAFLDVGDVTASVDDLDFGNLHWAVGGGLQYQTPIGSLQLSYGARITRLNEDPATTTPDPGSAGAFHITIGDAF